MPERQFFRVQQQAICGRKCFAFGVEFIAEDHVAECLHVYPQLVRTACQRKSRSRVVFSPRSIICQRVCAGLP